MPGLMGIGCRTQHAAWGRCDDRGISGSRLPLRAAKARFAQAQFTVKSLGKRAHQSYCAVAGSQLGGGPNVGAARSRLTTMTPSTYLERLVELLTDSMDAMIRTSLVQFADRVAIAAGRLFASLPDAASSSVTRPSS